MNNNFITKLTLSVVTVAALLAFLAPVVDNGSVNDADNGYGVSTYADDEFDFDDIKSE